jgi:myo-inositol-1(or 4)-monophosphatase
VNDPSHDLLATAAEAVQRAGEVICARLPEHVDDKGDRDPTSDVDLAAEHGIRDFLRTRTPEIPILGEEEGGPNASTGVVWVVDPIDGTVNYLHGLPNYAVSLSLIDDGETLLAATHLPELHTTYTALHGHGAHADKRRISTSLVTSLRESLVAIDQFTFSAANAAQVNALRLTLIRHLTPLVQRLRIHGASAIDLAWTAHGRLDACIILANNPWDTSAGVLLAREAGAKVVDIGGQRHTLRSDTTVVATPGIADQLVTAITQAMNDLPQG